MPLKLDSKLLKIGLSSILEFCKKTTNLDSSVLTFISGKGKFSIYFNFSGSQALFETKIKNKDEWALSLLVSELSALSFSGNETTLELEQKELLRLTSARTRVRLKGVPPDKALLKTKEKLSLSIAGKSDFLAIDLKALTSALKLIAFKHNVQGLTNVPSISFVGEKKKLKISTADHYRASLVSLAKDLFSSKADTKLDIPLEEMKTSLRALTQIGSSEVKLKMLANKSAIISGMKEGTSFIFKKMTTQPDIQNVHTYITDLKKEKPDLSIVIQSEELEQSVTISGSGEKDILLDIIYEKDNLTFKYKLGSATVTSKIKVLETLLKPVKEDMIKTYQPLLKDIFSKLDKNSDCKLYCWKSQILFKNNNVEFLVPRVD